MVQKKSTTRSELPQEGSGRTRGRPRQYDPERALAKAAKAFWKHGYAATSLDDLVAATGMNRPSLYAAFGDKRDLYLKTLTRYQQQSRAIGAQITADDPPLRVFLKRFYEAALAIYLESGDEARGCYSISTAPAQAVTDAAVRDFLAASISGTDAFVAKQIAKARERGEVPSDADPQALAQLATAALHTIAVRARVGVPRKQLRAVAAAAIDVICGPQKS
jgi:TetR/AcrR family transcriptional regulator, copper-responsive repressor